MRTLPTRGQDEKLGTYLLEDYKVGFFTPPQPKRTSFCGHSVDVQRQPRTNCEQCWAFYFMQNVEFTQMIGKTLITENGEKELTSRFGVKFVKKAKWFFTKVAEAKELNDQVQKEIEAGQLQDVTYDVVIPGADKLPGEPVVQPLHKEDNGSGAV